jgi:hypothetical protein
MFAMKSMLRDFFKRACLIRISALLVVFSTAAALERTSIEEHPTAQEIIDRAIARAEAQYESQLEAAFEASAISTIQSLDDDNQVTKTEVARYRLYPLRGALFEELIEKNGRALNNKERRDEEKKRLEFIREVEKRRARGDHPQPEQEPGIRFNHSWIDRYQLKLVGMEVIRGHRCWIIEFEPMPGKLPVRNMMDRALNQSTGRFWVSSDDFGLVRVEFALRKPFKYWGGFLAVIRNTDGRIDYQRVEPNVWLPARFDLKLSLEVIMIKDIRRRIEKTWLDYRRSNDLAESGNEIQD